MNQQTIHPTKGYEVDKEKSTFKEIHYKKIEENLPDSWEDLRIVEGYYVSGASEIKNCRYSTGKV